MVDFGRFPHTLKTKLVIGAVEPAKDENGDWVPGNSTISDLELECRAVPNGTGKPLPGVDGDKVIFNYLVYLPAEIVDIPEKTIVEFVYKGKVFYKGPVLRFFGAGRLNTRLWV
ncbi:hypothetical protein [Pedobacter jejuensis]|uniref:Uncharacterized protein n=1 Tax=Pedobacter jejuensis TaxID=1268550 RepID=A0A3N0BPE4_9SPHI|nr:hypothetical protein [Pedobacter jejuensis]RNL50771.1 hypothetical protein D7004_17945 [Pedobacter jejuensis]